MLSRYATPSIVPSIAFRANDNAAKLSAWSHRTLIDAAAEAEGLAADRLAELTGAGSEFDPTDGNFRLIRVPQNPRRRLAA